MPTDINSIQAWSAIISTLITMIASYFVVQTFLMQAKVMLEQSEITKLEIKRSIKEKNPLFTVKSIELNEYQDLIGEDHIERHKIIFTLERTDIHYLKIDIIHNNEFSKANYKYSDLPFQIEGGMIEGTFLELNYSILSKQVYMLKGINTPLEILDFTIKFTYKDILEDEYHQEIHFPYDAPPIAKPPLIPELKKRAYNFRKVN
jgi:hypothetical protein